MTIRFAKYHGLGSDNLVIGPNVSGIVLSAADIRLICDRNFRIGSDKILYGPAFENGR
jgi:diaminopimelate epimerase